MTKRIETTVAKVKTHMVRLGPDEKAIEREIAKMAEDGWVLTQRTDYNGFTRFDMHTRLTFQRYAKW